MSCVSVLRAPDSTTVVTVSESRAKNLGLTPLDQPAVDATGKPLPPRPLVEAPEPNASAGVAAKRKSTKRGAAAPKPEEATE